MELDLVENKVDKNAYINKRGFRIDAKSFFLTYPQCDMPRDTAAQCIKDKLGPKDVVEYMCVAREKHEDGHFHLHALVMLTKKKSVRNPFFWDLSILYHGNYQAARSSDEVRKYITKEDSEPYEEGVYHSNDHSLVQKRSQENKILLEKSMKQLVDDGDIHLMNYVNIRNARILYKLDNQLVPEKQPKKNMWIYGATGTGKSLYVRDNFGGKFYNKPMNKWWDGYVGERVVLLDDFDLGGQCLGHHLKIWADNYSFNAEVKGSTIKPIADVFIVTSQYLPRDIWCSGTDQSKWDDPMRQAIERRFPIYTVEDGVLVPYNN